MALASYSGGNPDAINSNRELTTVSDVTPCRLVVRCLLEHKDDQWQAFSLEFGLAAQADSASEAKHKLESMIESYVRDALTGEDREHAYELIVRRKATFGVFARYYWVYASDLLAGLCSRSQKRDGMIYQEPLPLQPCMV